MNACLEWNISVIRLAQEISEDCAKIFAVRTSWAKIIHIMKKHCPTKPFIASDMQVQSAVRELSKFEKQM